MSKKQKQSKVMKKGKLQMFGLLALFFIGVGLLVYPSFSDYWNTFHQSRVIMKYADRVSNMNKDEYARLIKEANQYNQELQKTGIKWNMTDAEKASYNRYLDFESSGVMGYITIPKINVELPIYHGTSDSILQTSIGHIEGSSLPVGGLGSHTILSGHRGLPSARLFTNLDQLAAGDTFTLTVLNETYTYEVDQIRIVEPTDLSSLQLEPGKDYCTLVTCTPYGVNTHRLLVRGHRVENVNGNAELVADAIQIRPIYITPFVIILLLFGLFLWSKLRRNRSI
ncbi:class C sortase [Streptococcus intermedius]|jgi:sortase family protein|uniref:Sortase n=1 Tax=Streptococcus intermedius TaxID=1338 RepID=A0AAD1FJ08_STRIT|nr:sortase family protein [Streptococcus intermedius C270]PMR63991.1 membrane protein insertase YidC [Streptococcus intermedius]RSJ18026.1 Sortase family protein [Streptococcus intermedius]RSJ26913.1 Sortase family protein [Streptococcus intermedius]BAW16096.1 sortase [Streptococcus intermedius]